LTVFIIADIKDDLIVGTIKWN